MVSLLAGLIAVPILVMALSGWATWREAWRTAETEVAQAAEAVAEYGLRVLTAHLAAAARVDALLREVSDDDIRSRAVGLQREMRLWVAELPRSERVDVIDRHDAVILSTDDSPMSPERSKVAGRDILLGLQSNDVPTVHVSGLHTSRSGGSSVFAVSLRRNGNGNTDGAPGAVPGLVSVTIDATHLSDGLRRIVGINGDVASLIRTDGQFLVRSGSQSGPTRTRPPLLEATAGLPDRATYQVRSVTDGVDRLFAARRIEGWPVYAVVGRSRSDIVAGWDRAIVRQLVIGISSTLILLGLAALVLRGQNALAAANADLEARVADRTAALADRERRLGQALEAGRVFAFEFDPEADIVRRSPNASVILGLPEAEAIQASGSGFLAGLLPEDRERVLTALGSATPDRPAYSARFRYQCPSGRVVWLQDQGVAEFGRDGKVRRLASLCRDVTAEVDAEQAVQEAQARLRAASEGAGLGTYEIDFARGAGWFDARAVEILGGGLPVATWFPIDGPDWAVLEARIHPDDSAAFAKAWEDVACGTADGWAVETRLQHPDGRWIYNWCHGSVVERDPATGRARRLVGVELDVTERRRLEADLRQAQKLEVLGQLSGGIAHDFNNVLQVVTGAAAMIERAAGAPDDVRRRARLMAEAVERGAAITGRLLAFARRRELKVEPLAPDDLLNGLRDLLSPLLGTRVTVSVEVAAGLPLLLADHDELQTALLNLATNARDAMPEGGTLALVAEADEVMEPSARLPPRLAPGRYVRLSIRDSGVGMDAVTLSRVTEPFFTTKSAGKGTGLGLPMAKALAEQSGGGFAIESAPGQGTTVSLWFPQVGQGTTASAIGSGERPLAAEHLQKPAVDGIGQSCHVIIVDDDPSVREVIAEQLTAAGLLVRATDGADAALALLDAGEPVDVLVTDYMMPGFAGMALIQEARRRRPGLPAVLLTGHVDDADGIATCGAKGGRFALLRKPASGLEIAARVTALQT